MSDPNRSSVRTESDPGHPMTGSEIDAVNRAPIGSATPDGEFVVRAAETYNWRLRPYDAQEMEGLRRAAREQLERPESRESRDEREAFVEELRKAARINGTRTRDNAVDAVRRVIRGVLKPEG